MHRFIKCIILFAVSVALLSNCATTSMRAPDQKPVITSKPDKATLVIFRDTKFGGATVFWTYLDGKLIGETKGNTFFITEVEPGPYYLFVVTENTVGGHINFEAGRTYSLHQGVTMGMWRTRSTGFYPMTQEEAAAAMARCKYQEYDPSMGGEDMDPQEYEQAVRDYEIEVKENPEGFRELLEYKGY